MVDDTHESNILSRRLLDRTAPCYSGHLSEHGMVWRRNPYCPKTNPSGIVNLGTSENRLMVDVLSERLSHLPPSVLSDQLGFFYFDFPGLPHFRHNLASFLTRKLRADEPLDPERIFIVNGSATVIDFLAQTLAEEGDAFLVPAPFYARIENDLAERARVKTVPVDLADELMSPTPESEREEEENLSSLTSKLRVSFDKAEAQGLKIKGIFLTNPGNPIGNCISRRAILQVLDFANQRNLHVIFDEVYAMSVTSNHDSFHSVASMSRILPDPSRVHLIWSFSKDFCLSGFRSGVLYSWNKAMIKANTLIGTFYMTPAPTQLLLNWLISDEEWLEKFFSINLMRLREAKDHLTTELKLLGIEVKDTSAGLFLWVNFRGMLTSMGSPYLTGERDLYNDLIKAGCFVLSGEIFKGEEPGWARIIFSVSKQEREEFLKRLKGFKESVNRQGNPQE